MKRSLTAAALGLLAASGASAEGRVEVHGKVGLHPYGMILRNKLGEAIDLKFEGIKAGFNALCAGGNDVRIVLLDKPATEDELRPCSAKKISTRFWDFPGAVQGVQVHVYALSARADDAQVQKLIATLRQPSGAAPAASLTAVGQPVKLPDIGLVVQGVSFTQDRNSRAALQQWTKAGRAIRVLEVDAGSPFHPNFQPGLVVFGHHYMGVTQEEPFADGYVDTPARLAERLARVKEFGLNHIVSVAVFVPKPGTKGDDVNDYELGTADRQGRVDYEPVFFRKECRFIKLADCPK